MTATIVLSIAVAYGIWVTWCILNAVEEKECEVTDERGFEVNSNGELIETITATFHTV